MKKRALVAWLVSVLLSNGCDRAKEPYQVCQQKAGAHDATGAMAACKAAVAADPGSTSGKAAAEKLQSLEREESKRLDDYAREAAEDERRFLEQKKKLVDDARAVLEFTEETDPDGWYCGVSHAFAKAYTCRPKNGIWPNLYVWIKDESARKYVAQCDALASAQGLTSSRFAHGGDRAQGAFASTYCRK